MTIGVIIELVDLDHNQQPVTVSHMTFRGESVQGLLTPRYPKGTFYLIEHERDLILRIGYATKPANETNHDRLIQY